MKQHYVTFLSPGTFLHEETTRPIDSWDTSKAMKMAHDIQARHSSTPFAFYFTTRERSETDLDSKQTAKSARYFLGGEIETLAQVKARATDADRILIYNMEGNRWDRIITNTNSWKITQPLGKEDVVLEWKPLATGKEASDV